MLSKHCGNCKHYEPIEKSRTGYCRKSGCVIEGKVINARRPSAVRCFEPRSLTNADRCVDSGNGQCDVIKILRLCDKIDDILSNVYNTGSLFQNCDYTLISDCLNEIRKVACSCESDRL